MEDDKFMFKIKAIYDTGDSFHTEKDVEYTFDPSYSSLEKVQETLTRLKEHYKYYRANNNYYGRNEEENGKVINEAKTKSWFVEEYDFCVKILTDEGEILKMSLPYCGYFETLSSLEIVMEKITF